MAKYVDDTLTRRAVFFSGKGGVGKTTLVWATALLAAQQKKRVVVAGWEEKPRFSFPGVEYLYLDTLACFREYALLTVKFEKVYELVFDNHVLRTFVTTAPGVSDGVIAGKIWNLATSGKQDLIVVDLPSSGHTVSFFKSPLGIRKVFSIGFIHKEADQICRFFESSRSRLDLVSLPEELPMMECLELKKQLRDAFPITLGYLHLNQVTPDFELPSQLPASLQTAFEDFQATKKMEAEVETMGRALELPTIKHPRWTSDSPQQIVEKASEELARA